MKKITLILILILTFLISCWDDVTSNDSTDNQVGDPAKFTAVKDSIGSQFILKTDSAAIAGIPRSLFIEISNYYKLDSVGAYYLNSDQSITGKTVIPVELSNDSVINIGNITFNKSGLTSLYYFVKYQDSVALTVIDVINFFVGGNAPKITANDTSDTLFSVKELDTLKIQYKAEKAYLNSTPYFSTITNLPDGANFDTTTGIFIYTPSDTVTVKDSICNLIPLSIVASDNSNPPISDTLLLYISVIDSPINTEGPVITQLSGTKDNERITVTKDTLTFEIEDPDDIDTVYYNLNGIYAGRLTQYSTNGYQLIFTLTQYGSNTIEIFAKDKSSLKNLTTKVININYNTIPSSIDNISPSDGTEGIDHSAGVNLNWTEGIDADGDSITYIVNYGNNTSALTSVNTTSKSTLLSNLIANTTYYWYVLVATSLDTIRCPGVDDTYFNFKTKDEGAPSIIQTSGPVEGDYVLTNSNSLIFSITDENGLDSVYYQINGGAITSATNTLNDEYKIIADFVEYGSNEIVLTAVDNSSSQNKSIKTINLIYYTIPTSVIALSPVNNAINVENISGVNLKWNSSTDADGDSIKYEVFYGENITSLSSAITTDTTYTVNSFNGGTEYSWYVNVITDHDTIRSPLGESAYFTFTTVNHPADIIGMNDKSATINDSVHFIVNATDLEGVKEFSWDSDDDGIFDVTNTTGKLSIKSQGVIGTQKIKVKVVDNLEGETVDSSIITVTNGSPQISGLSDTILHYIGDSLKLDLSYSDDGTIVSYEWDLGNGFIQTSNGDTTFIKNDVTIPTTFEYKVKITDEDGNIARDSTIIKMPVNYTIIDNDINSIAGVDFNVFKHKKTGKYNKIGRTFRVESNDFITWDTLPINSNMQSFNVMADHAMLATGDDNYYVGISQQFDVIKSNEDILCDSLPEEVINNSQFREGYLATSDNRSVYYLFGGYREQIGGGEVYNDTIYCGSYFQTDKVVGKLYLPATAYKMPVYQRNDSLWIINGRAGEKLTCMYMYTIGGANTMNIVYEKSLGFTSSRETIVLNDQDIYIISSDGRIFLSKDNGDNYTEIINDSDNFSNPLKAFMLNNNEIVIVCVDKTVKVNISKYESF